MAIHYFVDLKKTIFFTTPCRSSQQIASSHKGLLSMLSGLFLRRNQRHGKDSIPAQKSIKKSIKQP
ncbi:hypothetical protein GZ78_09085 [Endozoicomonas numazuensis]|uniref:Uncharacterized protein n=1 Tax=Endozoicomonas numazuensis TaxID=1137799 RepID=A0A081NH88_9GAMM|nr:hypothetical protein GZ78_09085 [Endozoicomonas numazuensis]